MTEPDIASFDDSGSDVVIVYLGQKPSGYPVKHPDERVFVLRGLDPDGPPPLTVIVVPSEQ